MKQALRKSVLGARSNQESEQVAEKSRYIVERVLQMPAFQNAKTIMVYVDFRKEVETGSLIEQGLSLGKRMVIPVCDANTVQLTPSEIQDYPGDLCPGTWGILEPKDGCLQPVDPSEIDIILVPGVAFDSQGNRLGYGAGYYDRFLARVRPDALKIALAFDLQIVENACPSDHDMPMDYVVTETRVISCLKAAPASGTL